jgi:hypothetical protein
VQIKGSDLNRIEQGITATTAAAPLASTTFKSASGTSPAIWNFTHQRHSGSGNLRVHPMLLRHQQAFTNLAAAVTSAGSTGCTLRIGCTPTTAAATPVHF